MGRILFISIPYFYNFKSDSEQWWELNRPMGHHSWDIYRHAPNATPDAASGASASLAVAGPVEIFRHAPNAMPDAAEPPQACRQAGQVVAGPMSAAGAVGVSGCSRAQWRTQCHDQRRTPHLGHVSQQLGKYLNFATFHLVVVEVFS